MYASAMKFCGAMELCGIGYPTNQAADHQWPDVEKQVAAQNAGLLIAMTRSHKPVEAELMLNKGFAPVYQFTNPRTGTRATVWIKDFTKEGGWPEGTKLPETIEIMRAASASSPASSPASTSVYASFNRTVEPTTPLDFTSNAWWRDAIVPRQADSLASIYTMPYNSSVASDSSPTPPLPPQPALCSPDNPCDDCASLGVFDAPS